MEVYENLLINTNLPYLRPFLCKGNPHKAKICLVGINPATPIYSKDKSYEEYVGLLKDYEKFFVYYSNLRKKRGLSSISRTRLGIINFIEWIQKRDPNPIIETDVYTIPTKNVKELEEINHEILHASQKLFFRVLNTYSPQIIILYGKKSLHSFFHLIDKEGIAYNINLKDLANMKIDQNPYIGEIIINGSKIKILAIRHLMYYGINGGSYNSVKKKIHYIIKSMEEGN